MSVGYTGRGRPGRVTEIFSPSCVTSEPVNSVFCEGDVKIFFSANAPH